MENCQPSKQRRNGSGYALKACCHLSCHIKRHMPVDLHSSGLLLDPSASFVQTPEVKGMVGEQPVGFRVASRVELQV